MKDNIDEITRKDDEDEGDEDDDDDALSASRLSLPGFAEKSDARGWTGVSGGCERDTGGTAGARDQDATEE